MGKNRISGLPNNWWEAVGIYNPTQPTEEEVQVAQRELVENAITVMEFVADLKKNVDLLCNDTQHLNPEQQAQVKRYQRLINHLSMDAEQLKEAMRADYEKAVPDAPSDDTN